MLKIFHFFFLRKNAKFLKFFQAQNCHCWQILTKKIHFLSKNSSKFFGFPLKIQAFWKNKLGNLRFFLTLLTIFEKSLTFFLQNLTILDRFFEIFSLFHWKFKFFLQQKSWFFSDTFDKFWDNFNFFSCKISNFLSKMQHFFWKICNFLTKNPHFSERKIHYFFPSIFNFQFLRRKNNIFKAKFWKI